MELKDQIREARRQAKLSQQALSTVIGVSDKAVSAYEVGRSSPPLKVLRKISTATGKPMTYFIQNEEEASPDQILAKLSAVEEEIRKLREVLEKGEE